MRIFTQQPLRRGSVAVMAAFCLIMVFAFAAISIDTGYITIVHQELLSAVDASALAAAQELRNAPAGGVGQVKAAAIEVAGANDVNGRPLVLDRREDVEIGEWNPDSGQFTRANGNNISAANAVRITGRLSKQRGNSVALFFAPVIDNDSVEMSESAIAVYGVGKPRDVVMVIDCSGSMSQFNRMTYTRPAALALIDELGEDDRLSLAVYSYPVSVGPLACHGPEMPLFARIAPPTGELLFQRRRGNGGGNVGGNGRGGNGRGNVGGNGRGGNGGGNGGRGTRLTGYLERPLTRSFTPCEIASPDSSQSSTHREPTLLVDYVLPSKNCCDTPAQAQTLATTRKSSC